MVKRMYELSKCTVLVVDDITQAFDEKGLIFSAERVKGLGEIIVKFFYKYILCSCLVTVY